DYALPPSPSSLSETGGFVIVDFSNGTKLKKFTMAGSYVCEFDLDSINFFEVYCICIAPTGEVIIGFNKDVFLLDSSLQIISSITLPDRVISVWQSQNGGFWCRYSEMKGNDYDIYMLEYNLDGSTSDPVLMYSGRRGDPEIGDYRIIAPDGSNHRVITDINGAFYISYWDGSVGNILEKTSPTGELLFTHVLNDDPDWEGCMTEYYFTRQGNFYTLHGTDDGEVLTKYSLQLE
ncbi:MAG: hypothetical protein ABIG42_04235, partial [bacterium]